MFVMKEAVNDWRDLDDLFDFIGKVNIYSLTLTNSKDVKITDQQLNGKWIPRIGSNAIFFERDGNGVRIWIYANQIKRIHEEKSHIIFDLRSGAVVDLYYLG